MDKKIEWLKLIGGLIALITAIIMLIITFKSNESNKPRKDKPVEVIELTYYKK